MHAGVVALAKAAKEDFTEAFKLYFGPLARLLQLCKRLVYPILIGFPPGWKLWRFAELCFSKNTFTLVGPILSDMQKEHFDALAAGRPWKARMILVRGYWSFWSTVAAQLPIFLARRVYEVWKAIKSGS